MNCEVDTLFEVNPLQDWLIGLLIVFGLILFCDVIVYFIAGA